MKIAIIGYSGSGKSTLARRLADELGIEPLYLDRVHFLPNWVERDEESAREIVRIEMAKPSWVIDGNYTHMLRDQRLQEADEIIWLNYPRLICLIRALKRNRDFRGKSRESMADGCIERMEWGFVWWILHKGRTRAIVKRYRAIAAQYPQKTAVIKSDQSLRRYLRERQNLNKGEQNI